MQPKVREDSHQRRKRRNMIFYIVMVIFGITIAIFISVHYPSQDVTTDRLTALISQPSRYSLSVSNPTKRYRLNAKEIVQRSYKNTFGALPIDTLCSLEVQYDNGVPWLIDGQTCINSLLTETMNISSSEHSSSHSFPWWYITMLRDNNKMFHWNNLTFANPPIDFCTIEKVGTTQWRRVQNFLNEGIEARYNLRPANLNNTRLQTRRKQFGHNISRVVFLRDPLERLLSGYINKCVVKWRRKAEGHCEPNVIFNGTVLTAKIEKDEKQLFAAYVDAFPLKWNMHFRPQALYCGGLFRHIDKYDFVGKMDDNFYSQLEDFASKFGKDNNNLPKAIEKVFNLTSELTKEQANVGKETRAASHVMEYYTPASVRRALEYYAVDYVTLELEIPSWVDDILNEENG